MTASAGGLRVIVLGYVVRGPLGALAWHHLQYVLGLSRLGHDVWFVEDSDDYPSCYDPVRDVTSTDPAYGLEFAAQAFERIGLGSRWAYHDAHGAGWHGPAADRVLAACATADVVINVSGVNPLRAWLAGVPTRVFVDTDPAFTQIRHLTDATARERALAHNVFLSYGENISRGTASVPDDGLPWQPTRQPIVVDVWPVTPGAPNGAFTTVMNWESYPASVHEGRLYGMKSASFAPYADLPRSVDATLEIALGGPNQPREQLLAAGWRLRDAREPTRDPWTYQRYVRESKAELSVAKEGYVTASTGWFSERSAGYLASGRPVVVQDAVFSEWLECGLGVLAFNSPEEARAAIEEVDASYERHCDAARALASEYFDSRGVLTDLLDRAGSTSRSVAP